MLRITDGDEQTKALYEILEKGLNVRQTDELVDKLTNALPPQSKPQKSAGIPVIKDVRIFNNTVKKAVSLMLSSGFRTESKEKEFSDRYEYHICIYK